MTDWIEKSVYGEFQAIDKEDMGLYKIVDSAEEAYELVQKAPQRKEF